MSTCSFCAWGSGLHDPHCPSNKETHSFVSDDGEWVAKFRPSEVRVWNEGWTDGRRGCDPQQDNLVYQLGYSRGQVALEEYENGYDPVWMS